MEDRLPRAGPRGRREVLRDPARREVLPLDRLARRGGTAAEGEHAEPGGRARGGGEGGVQEET